MTKVQIMQQTKTFTIGLIAVGNTSSFSFQFDAAFPDTSYATGVSLASNSLTQVQTAAGIKGLRIVSMNKRPDGIDLTLSNPDSTDWTSDTVEVWAGND